MIPSVDKTLMDAIYTFLLKFLFRVLKGTASHETFRKWVEHQEYGSFLSPAADTRLATSLSSLFLPKFATDFYDYLTLTNSVGNNAAMKYIKNVKQVLDEAVVQGWLAKNSLESYKCSYIDPEQ